MPHCSRCGTVVDAAAAYCHSCGAAQGPVHGSMQGGAPGAAPGSAPGPVSGATVGAGPGASAPSVAVPGQPALQENVAGLLCYSLLWLTGLIFFLIDKRPFVRFHAAQSLVAFGALQILSIMVSMIFGAGFFMGGPMRWTDFGVAGGVHSLIDLVTLILWIAGMITAYRGERFRIPIAADFADQLVGK